jgi:PAS domain S-box-containing protein
MSKKNDTEISLRAENEQLRSELAEAQETLHAIRNGEVDALVVGEKLYVLTGADAASNQLRGRALAEVSDAVFTIDNDSRVTWMNAAAERQYGVTAAQALGCRVEEIYASRWLLAEGEAAVQRSLQETGHWRGENIHRTRSGAELHVESSFGALRDEQGAISGILATFRDITARKHAEEALRGYAEQLKKADRRKDEFLATLAHELRNPLAPIRNATAILKRSQPGSTNFQTAIEITENQVAHMVRLIEDLLDISRISTGKIELKKERVTLHSIVDQAVETSRPHIDEKGHKLNVVVPEEPLWLEADAVRLAQVLSNLINNACKYSEPNGTIELRACLDSQLPLRDAEPLGSRPDSGGSVGSLVFSVKDRGIGIAPEHLLEIFDLFSQVDSALDRAEGGLGIGLSLVKGVVELHGGSVEAKSEGVGRGSEFIVRLPITETGLGQSTACAAAELVSAPERAGILVVDDQKTQAQSLAMLLDGLGYETRTAYNGESALTALEEFTPKVALLDIGLPGMNGYELARRIRLMPQLKNITLIAQTGWGTDKDREDAKRAGFDYHLTKPVNDRLLATILSEKCPPG